MLVASLVVCALVTPWIFTSAGRSNVVRKDSGEILIGNDFVQLVYDSHIHQISGIFGDFQGQGNFTKNVLASAMSLQIDGAKELKLKTAPQLQLSIGEDRASLQAKVTRGNVDEEWTFDVSDVSREIKVHIRGSASEDIKSAFLNYGIFVTSPSLYGLFSNNGGALQMMGKSESCLGSQDVLERAYFLGDGSALDVIVHSSTANTVVFHSNSGNPKAASTFQSGLEFQVAGGTYPNLSKKMLNAWGTQCWDKTPTATVSKGTSWELELGLVPNNFNFPAYIVRDLKPNAPVGGESSNLESFFSLQTYLTGAYASPAGCLQSYYEDQRGIIAPTIAHPDIGYSPDTNFFDPDNFLTLSAMMYTGDALLLREVQAVLERTMQTMCGLGTNTDTFYCAQNRQRLRHEPLHMQHHRKQALHSPNYAANARAGQLMHHFISLQPTYESIAGSEQLGPNIFWTLAALRYVGISGDSAWALKVFPFVDLSTKFLVSFVDPAVHLVDAPGPLWIDVLVREQYTSDSNAMMVPVLREIADFYEYVAKVSNTKNVALQTVTSASADDLIAFANDLRNLAQQITVAINDKLWAPSKDHLVTQLNKDGSTRDFVDYDANLIAIAAGIISPDQIPQVLQRIDSGVNTHIRATWCSEVAYTGDACDCYIVGGSVCGDSVVTLARIGWVDGLARYRTGDATTIRDVLLRPLQDDLVRDTWLSERYDAAGNQIRTTFYFEYPALVTILLREVVFGIHLHPHAVDIRPLETQARYLYQLGEVLVDYQHAPAAVRLSLPGAPETATSRATTVYQLAPQATYLVSWNDAQDGREASKEMSTEVVSDAEGVLRFEAVFVSGRVFTITQSK